ncbi:hypothetical protein CHS0354_025711 [Potamilus streckersoni]|uniref:Major facilitator superfamily (MFS) profile domain-containing protein n=1 Tax=Potamilus streckersoni TaxID=2493646 RepID=A0AAE0S0V3_9BIVA|nr:hypothetical protein CHS0354_025711 [Potamilus streckersoni]
MAEELVSETTPLLKPTCDPPTELLSRDTDKKDEFSWNKITRRQKFLFICMGLINFGACTCFSLLSPFFPTEAQKKGATQTEIGFIFGVYELVIFVSSPVFGNFIAKIGAKFMFVTGIMVCGACTILFGNLNAGPDGTTFVVMCFVVRSVEALGCSAFVTSLFAIVAYEFPAYSTTVIGSLETFSGLGLMVGPPLGGALYELGGFGLPFFVLGSMVLVTGLSVAAVMPNVDQGQKPYEGSVLTLLKSPLVLVTLLIILASSSALGYLDPTLADHLAQFKLKTWVVGFIFLIAPAVYAITAPVWGWLGDTKGLTLWMIGIGTFFSAFAVLFLGPAPFLPFIPDALYINIISLVLLGLLVGCALIPTFKALILGANSLGMPDDLSTSGKVSGLFNAGFSLGSFVGPTAGGALVEHYGFPWASSGCAALLAVSGILFSIYIFFIMQKPPASLPGSLKDFQNESKNINDTASHAIVVMNGDVKDERTGTLRSANLMHDVNVFS